MFVTTADSLSAMVDRTMVVERGRAWLSVMFGGIALILASVGLHGVAARLLAERRREIGIRIALGADRRAIGRLVLADTGLIVGLGLVAGLPVAIAASRMAEGLLFGVSAAAPHVLALPATALTIAALAATAAPLRRAVRIDPAVTLRDE